MLRGKGVYPFQLIPALCRNSAKQTCMAPVSNYHILTASARTHGHNNFHFILTSWSNRVNNKHDGYQYKAPSKAAEIHTKNNLCVSNIPTISCHCSCLLASFAKGKKKNEINKNNTTLLTKNILSGEVFLCFFLTFVMTCCCWIWFQRWIFSWNIWPFTRAQKAMIGLLLLVRRSKLTEEKTHNETVSFREKKIIFTDRFGAFYFLCSFSFNIFFKFCSCRTLDRRCFSDLIIIL